MEKIFNFLRNTNYKIYNINVISFKDGNKYVVDGEKQKKINVKKTDRLVFKISNQDYKRHPLNFSKTKDGIHNKGDEYTTNIVLESDNENTTITINLEETTQQLYYYCNQHKDMGSVINIKSSSYGY